MRKYDLNKLSATEKAWLKFLRTIGILLFILGVGIIGIQIFIYLKDGTWIQVSLLILAAFGPEAFTDWLGDPSSWIGLHSIIFSALKITPVSLLLIVSGYITFIYNDVE